MLLEQGQDDPVSLGHVEAQRYFPGPRIITALAKGHVEAAFTIGESSQIVADPLRDLRNV
jgi:hypothetical protein